MRSEPLILGIRHHSPACARLVASRIRALRPAFVLIEGPADFNARLAELDLPHRLPIAIYSYLATETRHHGSWSPLAEHSPEWQALRTGREVGAEVRFIDLPAWHEAFASLENRYADVSDAEHEARAGAYERALAERLSVQGRDALWDHLFENEDAGDGLQEHLHAYFTRLRGDDPGSLGNQARERMMSAWIAWAMAQPGARHAPVLVVCGGYHAPALARLWSEMPTELPETPTPDTGDGVPQKMRFGSYLVPYTFKRLDAFAGYASGMPSPAWYQWVWEHGGDGAARESRGRRCPPPSAMRGRMTSSGSSAARGRATRGCHQTRKQKSRPPARCNWRGRPHGSPQARCHAIWPVPRFQPETGVPPVQSRPP